MLKHLSLQGKYTSGSFTAILLLAIILVGLLVRLEDLTDWQQNPQIAFQGGEPLLTTMDGYYYLRLARDLAQNSYEHLDSYRNYPSSPKRPYPPPLLSATAASLHNLTGMSLNWIGAILPAFLGIIIVFPLFGLGRILGSTLMGLTAALLVVLNNNYMYRSSLGWFDTDCMNVTFAMTTVYFFMRFSICKSFKRYYWFSLALVIYLLFLWWWNTTPSAVTAIVAVPFFISIVFFYRPTAKEGLIFSGILLCSIVLLLVWLGPDFILRLIHQLFGSFQYVSKQEVGSFPNVSQLVSEQRMPTFLEIVASTMDSYPAFLLAIFGTVALFVKNFKKALFLLGPLLLSLMAYFYAKRFIIFIAPVSALGFGYFIHLLWQYRKQHPFAGYCAPVIVIMVALISFRTDMNKNYWPKTESALAQGMEYMDKNTPLESVIFAWWDFGYPLQYWANRPTVTDGEFHGGEISVYNALPLATSDPRLSANFISFLITQGVEGFHTVYQAIGGNDADGFQFIKEILAAGPQKGKKLIESARLNPVKNMISPQQWLRFFFPETERPYYLFLDFRLTMTTYWWFWLGTWDIKKHDGIHPRFRSFYQINNHGYNNYVSNGKDLLGNLTTGKITLPESEVQVKQARIIEDKKLIRTYSYNTPDDNFFDMIGPAHFAALQNSTIHNSVFSRLFIRQENLKYFKPVKINNPVYQIYRVNGEKWHN